MTSSSSHEFALDDIGADGITSLSFSPRAEDLLLSGSWDGTARLFDARGNTLRHVFDHGSPVLSSCFVGKTEGAAATGATDGTVRRWDLATGAGTALGRHDGGVRSVEYSEARGLVLTGGWDKTLRAWDPRAARCAGVHTLPDKVFATTVADLRIVLAMGGRHVWVMDVRNLAEPEQIRESSLQHQTRCVRAFPDATGYALSSVEGRVAIEYFDPSPDAQARKYAFKCHRATVASTEFIFPVNAIAFHQSFGTFATGGCDGFVNVWDPEARKRLCQYRRYPAGIAALAFNTSGTLMATASSYTFEEGDRAHPEDQIFIRHVQDTDVMPKRFKQK
jgi:cell cycle arrest protein BUB3